MIYAKDIPFNYSIQEVNEMKEKKEYKKVCNKTLWYGLGLPYVAVIIMAFLIMLGNFHLGIMTLVVSTFLATIVGILELSGCLFYKIYKKTIKEAKI